MTMTLYNEDCLEGMKKLQNESIDTIISDPPYQLTSTRVYPKDTKIEDISEQLKRNVEENTAYGSAIRGFMGKEWDVLPSVGILKECLRVLKSGAFALWLMTPRMDSQVEFVLRLKQAGFNIAFTPLYYCYASGFPKSMSLSKAVDKRLGFEREKIRVDSSHIRNPKSINGGHNIEGGDRPWMKEALEQGYYDFDSDIPVSEQSKLLDGSYAGFNPKPAVEVIIVAMKPIKESTYIDQALLHLKEPECNQLGGTWLDDCRIPYMSNEDPQELVGGRASFGRGDGYGFKPLKENTVVNNKGRFPANLLISDNIFNILSNGQQGSTTGNEPSTKKQANTYGDFKGYGKKTEPRKDTGSFSCYFSLDEWYKVNIDDLPKEQQKTVPFLITPKPSTSEKNKGLNEHGTGSNTYNKKCLSCNKWALKQGLSDNYTCNCEKPIWESPNGNTHPTVKSIALMSYLITLATREKDIVLDPFMGSGTTGIASYKLNRKFIGFEREKKYFDIAQQRIKTYTKQMKLGLEIQDEII